MHSDLPPKQEIQQTHENLTTNGDVFQMNEMQLRTAEALHDSLKISQKELAEVFSLIEKEGKGIKWGGGLYKLRGTKIVYFRLLDDSLICLEKFSMEGYERYSINCRNRSATLTDLHEIRTHIKNYTPLANDGIFERNRGGKIADVNGLLGEEL